MEEWTHSTEKLFRQKKLNFNNVARNVFSKLREIEKFLQKKSFIIKYYGNFYIINKISIIIIS